MLLLLSGFLYYSYGFMIHVTNEGKRINLAGSERMRSFEIAYHLNRLPENREFHETEIKEHVRDFEETLYALAVIDYQCALCDNESS